MSLSGVFNKHTAGTPAQGKTPRAKRPAPFSLRLTPEERARLEELAGDVPLGAYIKAKALGDPLPRRARRSGLAVRDKKALAQALAMLGRSRLSNNLNQLAHAANIGTLPVDPDTIAALHAALEDVRYLRCLLMTALGLKAEIAP